MNVISPRHRHIPFTTLNFRLTTDVLNKTHSNTNLLSSWLKPIQYGKYIDVIHNNHDDECISIIDSMIFSFESHTRCESGE